MMKNIKSFFKKMLTKEATATNSKLHNYLISVYRYIALAIITTGIVAFGCAYSGILKILIDSPWIYFVIIIIPFIITFIWIIGLNKLKADTVKALYYLYSVCIGCLLAPIFFVVNNLLIFKVFFITVSLFLSLSIFGYRTKKDLSVLEHILFTMLIGILISLIINLFISSSMFDFIISCISVLVFSCLIAYDTQELYKTYYVICKNNNQDSQDNQELVEKCGIFGAVALYLDFLNLFIHILNILRHIAKKFN